jgi:hypothetical protein
MNSRILGFDNRLMPDDFVPFEWGAERRERYLLRPDIAWPKSVDTMIWPSLFAFTQYRETWHERLPTKRIEVEPTDLWHSALRLWRNYGAMTGMLNERGSEGIPLKIELITETPVEEDELWKFLTVMPELDEAGTPAWTPLGYDLADGALISGLANCGYLEEERDSLKAAWAGRLNEHGLFDNIRDAAAYRVITDQRVQEHAPFYVVGLYVPSDRPL